MIVIGFSLFFSFFRRLGYAKSPSIGMLDVHVVMQRFYLQNLPVVLRPT